MRASKFYKPEVAWLLALALLFSSCSHRVWREGYATRGYVDPDCTVTIKKQVPMASVKARRIGKIKLGDSGMSTRCNELDARFKLRQEACSVGANFVNIEEEHQPDLWSSCYRCTASLYYLPVDSTAEAPPLLQQENETGIPLKYATEPSGAQVLGYVVGVTLGVLVSVFMMSKIGP